jgi:hypothetical protein
LDDAHSQIHRANAEDADFTMDVPHEDLMPSVENQPPYLFVPGPGIGSADVVEIALIYLLQLSGSATTVQKGALRSIPLMPHRYEELSDSAQRFMKPIT